MTVRELFLSCGEMIAKGNGDCQVLISDNVSVDEFHKLYDGFIDNENEIKKLDEKDRLHGNNPEKTVLLH